MNIIVNILLNIIILRILCPLIVFACAVVALFFLFDHFEINTITNILRPISDLIVNFFRETVGLLKGLM